MDKAKIANMVDDLVKWDRLMNEGKKIIDELKGQLQREAVELMEQEHSKQVSFSGTDGNRVMVTSADTVELIFHSVLKNTFGDTTFEMVKEEMKYSVTAPFKKLATSVFAGEYGNKTLNEVVVKITTDSKTTTVLMKKLKGNLSKDADVLMAVVGMDAASAAERAVEVRNAITYSRLTALAVATSKSFDEVVQGIRNSMIVDESIKIGVEYEAEANLKMVV